jgi:hypothetical protein
MYNYGIKIVSAVEVVLVNGNKACGVVEAEHR